MLDLGTGSNCLPHTLLRQLWAAGVAAFGVGVDIDRGAITSANTKRVLLSLPAASGIRGGSPLPVQTPPSPSRWDIAAQYYQARNHHQRRQATSRPAAVTREGGPGNGNGAPCSAALAMAHLLGNGGSRPGDGEPTRLL